jgi:hypothetical protein
MTASRYHEVRTLHCAYHGTRYDAANLIHPTLPYLFFRFFFFIHGLCTLTSYRRGKSCTAALLVLLAWRLLRLLRFLVLLVQLRLFFAAGFCPVFFCCWRGCCCSLCFVRCGGAWCCCCCVRWRVAPALASLAHLVALARHIAPSPPSPPIGCFCRTVGPRSAAPSRCVCPLARPQPQHRALSPLPPKYSALALVLVQADFWEPHFVQQDEQDDL